MAQMSMNKAIHGAFRRDLRRFQDALDRFPAGDAARASALHGAWRNFESQLSRHHHDEHDIAWEALQQVGVSAEVIAQMDSEHDALASALTGADTSMSRFATAPTVENSASAKVAVDALASVGGGHMAHEEEVLEPVFQAKKDDPVIKAMGRKFGKVSPAVGGEFFAWVTDGATPDEMAAIRSNVPAPVIAIIGGIFGRSYRKNVAPVWR